MGAVRRTLVSLVAGVATGTTLTACSITQEACTDIGAVPGVFVDYGAVLRAHPGEVLHAKACLAQSCRTNRIPAARPDLDRSSVVLGSATVADGTPLDVRLTITDPRGRTVFDGRTTAIPQQLFPNGPHCGADGWGTHVTATGTRTLTPA